MASKTGSQLVQDCRDGLGDRSTGQIGGRSVEDACLDKINEVIMELGKKYLNMPALQRYARVDLTTSNFIYALPVLDTSSNAIRVRAIERAYFQRVGETTAWPAIRISDVRRNELFPITSSSLTQGRPLYYTQFGSNLEFHPFPDTNYYFHMHVKIWPVDITINEQHVFGEEWDDVIAAGALKMLHALLGQFDDATSWENIYLRKLQDTKTALNEKPDWKPSPQDEKMMLSQNPVDNPFVRRFNS